MTLDLVKKRNEEHKIPSSVRVPVYPDEYKVIMDKHAQAAERRKAKLAEKTARPKRWTAAHVSNGSNGSQGKASFQPNAHKEFQEPKSPRKVISVSDVYIYIYTYMKLYIYIYISHTQRKIMDI